MHDFNRLNSEIIYDMALKEHFLTILLAGKPDLIPIIVCLFSMEFLQEVLGQSIILCDGRTRAQLKPIRHEWSMDFNFNK